MFTLTTERLLLEPLQKERHWDGFRAMNSDPEVMRYITGPSTETEEQTEASLARVAERWKEWGYSWFAMIERATGEVIGAACLQHLERDRAKPHEIGWRLRRDRWGRGYATEAAAAIVHHAFTAMDVPFLVAVAHQDNAGSIGVMKKLGMRFDHAGTYWDLPAVLYRLDRDDYLKKAA